MLICNTVVQWKILSSDRKKNLLSLVSYYHHDCLCCVNSMPTLPTEFLFFQSPFLSCFRQHRLYRANLCNEQDGIVLAGPLPHSFSCFFLLASQTLLTPSINQILGRPHSHTSSCQRSTFLFLFFLEHVKHFTLKIFCICQGTEVIWLAVNFH